MATAGSSGTTAKGATQQISAATVYLSFCGWCSFEGEWVNDAAPDMVQGKPTTQTLLNKKRAPARKKSNYN